jgi:flagellar biogenesis protein FliO
VRRLAVLAGFMLAVIFARVSLADLPAPANAPSLVATSTPPSPKVPDNFENEPFLRVDKPAPAATGNPTALPQGNSFDATRIMLALGGIVCLIFLLKAAAKRIFPGVAAHRASRAIKVLSRTTISPRQHLLLIQVGKRLLVVGDSGTQLNPLCEIGDESETAALLSQLHEETVSAAWRFDTLFGRARKGFGAGEDEPVETEISTTDTPAESSSAPPAHAQFDPTHELPDASVAQTQKELSGLSEKVRDLTRQLGRAS